MWEDHPSIEDFKALVRGAPKESQARGALAAQHLLTGCPSCLGRLQEIGWDEQRFGRLLWLSAPEVRHAEDLEPSWRGYDYTQAFAAAERSLIALFCQESVPPVAPEKCLSELLRLPEEEQILRAAESSEIAHPAVVRLLIDQSHAVRYEDHRKMLHLAGLARIAGDACGAEAAGHASRLADLRARAWMQYGNALRVCGKLPESDEALASAQRFQTEGTRDPLLRARLLEHMVSLRTFQGELKNAVKLAEEAGEIYRQLGEQQFLARTMVQKAIAALYAGWTETAIRTLNRAILLIDPNENPHLLLAACHNLIRGYIDLDQPEQALSLYVESRTLYKEFDADSTILLRAGWQEGQLLRDLGHLGAAENALAAARKGFLDRGLAYEVALVSLDLASVYVRSGKVDALKRTVSEALPIFRALRVGREAIGSLLQLRQAAGQEQKALELIRALNERLKPLAHNPAGK